MIVDDIVKLFAERGAVAYHGEAVSQMEHALQAAALAIQEAAPDYLIVAALLHDIGHLLDGQEEVLAIRGLDGHHEEAGYTWLARYFSPDVTEPIRLHVAAKRYLCAIDDRYLESLSLASRRSLALQGGPMTTDEIANFERIPRHQDAVRLRRWDDMAKVLGLKVPGLHHYRDRLAATVCLARNS